MPGQPVPPAGQLVAPATVVLVPVKAFHLAKARLAGVLDGEGRAALARRMATVVVRAGAPLPVAVVCDDDDVAAWATGLGARVLWRPGRGLNPAVQDAVTSLAALGYKRVVVAHADLPLARELAWVARFPGVTIVPDRRDDGTNVLSVPTDADFTFAYGVGSFRRHAAESRRIGRGLRVVREPGLGWDIDIPDDLDALRALDPSALDPEVPDPSAFAPEVLEPTTPDPPALDPEVLDPEVLDPSALDPTTLEGPTEQLRTAEPGAS
jgi:2-phospho-L-lactate guanylyltransferase